MGLLTEAGRGEREVRRPRGEGGQHSWDLLGNNGSRVALGQVLRTEGQGSSLEPRMSLRFRMGHCISGPEEWARPPNQGGKGSWWATGGGSACLRRPQGHRALQTVATGNLPQERPSLPTPPPVPSPGRREKPGCEHPDTAGVRQRICSVPRECLTVPRHPYHVGASFPF